MADYELWLDESGDFTNEGAKRKKGYKPSLIGGILVNASEINISQLQLKSQIDMVKNHAKDLDDTDKTRYILPVLQHLKENGCREVFFENADYDDEGNRSLYIHMMAEGLIQLMQYLNAQDQYAHLNVLIARRQDITNAENQTIVPQEYLDALDRCIDQKKKEHRVAFSKDCNLKYSIDIATNNERLVVADFACNTRLTRDSKAFEKCRGEVADLYTDALIFTMNEIPSKNFIETRLAKGLISDAIVELYSTEDKLDREDILNTIFKRIEKMSYRLVKSQLRQNRTEMIALIASESNYEEMGDMLSQLEKELLPRVEELGENFSDYAFEIYMAITDIYLREGDLPAAKRVLKKCEAAQKKMGNAMENLLSYYRLIEKQALYFIDAFDFAQADELMSKACEAFVTMMGIFDLNDSLKERYPSYTSEYYGDALCMRIYALMFMQHENPKLYKELVQLSDIALTQYPKHEGELERHRQYRSRIEATQGNCDEALVWLIKAKCYGDPKTDVPSIREFLANLTVSEEPISCEYYLMYYFLIMRAAEQRDQSLWDRMYEALVHEKDLLRIVGLWTDENSNGQQEVQMNAAQPKDDGVLYHPMEINNLEYARILYQADNRGNKELAVDLLKKTLKQGQKVKHYVTLRMACLSVGAELISMLESEGKKTISYVQNLLGEADELLALDLETASRAYIEQWREYMNAHEWKKAVDMLGY